MFKTALWFAAAALALAFFAPDLLVGVCSRPGPRRPPRADVVAGAAAVARARASAPHEQSIAADAGGQYSVDVAGRRPVGPHAGRHRRDDGGDFRASSPTGIGLSVESGQANGGCTPPTATPSPPRRCCASIDLGSIYMTDVPALIADRSAGDVNLLGASFLKRLASVEQRNGMLILRQ